MFRRTLSLLGVTLFALSLLLNTVNADERGLVAYWPPDGDTDDATGGGNNGTIHGATEWVTDGIQGEALGFNGAARLDCGNSAVLAPSPMSCIFWMRPSKDLTATDPRMNIVYFGKGPMFAYNKLPAAEEPVGPLGTIRCWVDTLGEVSKGTLFTKNNSWKKDVWYHLACTYDEKELVLYEDGVATGKVEALGEIGPRGGTFKIGDNFTGAVDEVKLYDRALTSQEVLVYSGMAVEPTGKLTDTWGNIKRGL